jgi:hypothetical protein
MLIFVQDATYNVIFIAHAVLKITFVFHVRRPKYAMIVCKHTCQVLMDVLASVQRKDASVWFVISVCLNYAVWDCFAILVQALQLLA